MYFGNYGLQKTKLDKFLKGLISQDPLTNSAKHGRILNDSIFILVNDHFEGKWVRKSLF